MGWINDSIDMHFDQSTLSFDWSKMQNCGNLSSWISRFPVLAHWLETPWALSNHTYRLYDLYLDKFMFTCLPTILYKYGT